MNQVEHKFFGVKIYARFGIRENNLVPISVVDSTSSEAWHKVFNYDSSVETKVSGARSCFLLFGIEKAKDKTWPQLLFRVHPTIRFLTVPTLI